MKKIGFWEAYSIGLGGMIGGGIFAVLGLTLLLAKGAAPVAFIIAGIIALLTSYSYAKLSVRYPSEGGTVEFLVRAFGNNYFTGYLNTLLLASYVIMLSLYSYAFGSYASALFFGEDIDVFRKLMTVLVIVFFTVLNFLGAYMSGKAEDIMVFMKVGILLFFSALGLFTGDFSKLSPENWESFLNIMVGGLVIFLAYEGFELIANTAQDIEDPENTLPKAFYLAVSTVILIYVLVSIVAVINLTYEDIQKYSDFALAVAAKPILGKAGFVLIGIAALLSTASAINATLYGSARVSYIVAKFGALPKSLSRHIWKNGTEGLIILAVLTSIFAVSFNLENISIAGSLGFLLIFAFVNLANFRLYYYTDANRWISLTGFFMCVVSALVLVYHTLNQNPQSLSSAVVVLILTFIFELVYRTFTGVKLEKYIDWKLKEREEILDEYEKVLEKIKNLVSSIEKEAEVILTGKLAQKGREKSGNMNVVVLVSKEKKETLEKSLFSKLKFEPHHPITIKVKEKNGVKS